MLKVKALLFDVFGTVVDWRTGIAQEVESVAKKNDISLDPFDFADAWRAEYQPAMEEIRKGRRSFTAVARGELRSDSLIDLEIVYKAPDKLYTRSPYHFGSRILFDNEFAKSKSLVEAT